MSQLQSPLRKNDNVLVIAGKDRGKKGRVLKAVAAKNRLVVEGVNMIKRHTKPNPQRNVKGGIVEREASLHASNVQPLCPECGAQTRIGHKMLGDGRKVRVCRKCEGVVDKMNRLRERYENEVVPALKKEFGYTNIMAVPKIKKVVVNMGLGEATSNAKIIEVGSAELASITGQKPVVRRAKKSIAAFKVRKGQPVGTSVTLRGERMYEFLDRLMAIALPRVRDFRGVSPKGFDGRGNFTLGLKDQLLFPEIDYMKFDKARGMNVSVVTTARTDHEARKLLQLIGMPFRTN